MVISIGRWGPADFSSPFSIVDSVRNGWKHIVQTEITHNQVTRGLAPLKVQLSFHYNVKPEKMSPIQSV